MPIYDYGCSVCGRVTEVIHGINDPGPRFCPACGAEGSMKKALSTPAIVFKGSGWAKLDRRGTSGGRSSGGGTAMSRSSEGSSESASKSGDSGSGDGSSAKPAPSAPASSAGSED